MMSHLNYCWIYHKLLTINFRNEKEFFLHLTFLSDSKYSKGLLKAVKAASWNGAGAESVILTWMFLIADAMKGGAMAHPTLQPDRQHNKMKQGNEW